MELVVDMEDLLRNHIGIMKFPIFLDLRGSKLRIMRRNLFRRTYGRGRSRCNVNMALSNGYAHL